MRWLLVWMLLQLLLVPSIANGPTGDEGIYAWLGMRAWREWPQVNGGDWVNGSPLGWPPIAGVLWWGGGVWLLRWGAAALVTGALWLVLRATERLHGESAGTAAALVLLTNGPLFAVAHLGVYDVPALVALAVAIAAMARRSTGGSSRWLVLTGVAAGAAVVFKYALVFVAPFVVLALAEHRRRDLLLAGAVATVVVVGHNLLVLGAAVPQSYGAYREAAAPVGRLLIVGEQLFLAAPLLLAAVVWRPMRPWSLSWRDGCLLAALLAFPLFHVATGNPQSAQEHAAIGLLAAAPSLGRLWMTPRARPWRRTTLTGGLLLGVLQWVILEYSWVNASGVTAQLVRSVQPGETIYVTEGTFRSRAELYRQGLDGGLQDLDVNAPPPSGARLWVVTETPMRDGERAWLDHAVRRGLQPVAQWTGWHIGADGRRPFGLHRVETSLYLGTLHE